MKNLFVVFETWLVVAAFFNGLTAKAAVTPGQTYLEYRSFFRLVLQLQTAGENVPGIAQSGINAGVFKRLRQELVDARCRSGD